MPQLQTSLLARSPLETNHRYPKEGTRKRTTFLITKKFELPESGGLGFFGFFRVRFLYGDSVHVVVGAERYDFEVRCNVVHNAAANPVNVKVVAVHERHAAQQKDAAADFAQ